MPALATENWTGRTYTRGKSGRRSWTVSEAADGQEAIDAVVSQFGVNVNSPFPEDARLRADTDPSAEKLGPTGYYTVDWNYIRPEAGSVTEDPDNPLDDPIKFRWGRGVMSLPSDVDALGYAVVNAANLPFDGGVTSDIRYRILTMSRNQSSYNITLSLAFENTFNHANVTIPGAGTLAPGQLLCESIEPTSEYDETSEYVNVAYTFWMWQGWNLDSDGFWDSWKHRIPNRSGSGWWSDAGTKKIGPFVDLKGEPLNELVMLAADGTPFRAATYKILSGGLQDPVSRPTDFTLPSIETTSYGSYMKYRKAILADFSGMSLF